MVVMTSTMQTLEDIRQRTARDRAEYTGEVVDRSILDREYLLELLEKRV